MKAQDEAHQLAVARDAVLSRVAGTATAEDVDRLFAEVVSGFAGAPVRTYVPVLAEREVRSRLRKRS